MAITKTTGVTDTPISGVTSLTLSRGLVNFSEDFRVKTDDPGKEVIITNITSGLDSPETFRFSYSDLKNIYSGTEIDPNLMAPSKAGISLLVELKQTFTVTDSANPALCVQLPLSCHLVVKIPKSGYLAGSDVLTAVGRVVSGLFDTGSTSDTRLNALLKGVLTPSSL